MTHVNGTYTNDIFGGSHEFHCINKSFTIHKTEFKLTICMNCVNVGSRNYFGSRNSFKSDLLRLWIRDITRILQMTGLFCKRAL